MSNLQTEFVEQSGRKANTLVLGARTITGLKNHPDIIDRIKYTQRGVVTTDGVENDVLLDDAGTAVVGGPTVDRDDADDADDVAERERLLADVTVDHEQAVSTALAEAGDGAALSDLDLDVENGRAVWQVGFGDDTATGAR